jgi:hypothetical protein
MSRSNPHESTPNPAVRWFEWTGEGGTVRYYDKDAKKNIDVGDQFEFMLLDQLGSVRGWHDASDSGIYSNEVKDTTREPLVVKSFKGGTLAEGVYRSIKDKVNAQGGKFNAVLYIAFDNDGEYAIGSLRLKGAALAAWMEFSKANRGSLYKQAVYINGYNEGKKGRITFRVPIFELVDVSPDVNQQANGLDAELQTYLKAYFKRNTKEQVQEVPPDLDEEGGSQVITDEDLAWSTDV